MMTIFFAQYSYIVGNNFVDFFQNKKSSYLLTIYWRKSTIYYTLSLQTQQQYYISFIRKRKGCAVSESLSSLSFGKYIRFPLSAQPQGPRLPPGHMPPAPVVPQGHQPVVPQGHGVVVPLQLPVGIVDLRLHIVAVQAVIGCRCQQRRRVRQLVGNIRMRKRSMREIW